MHFAPAFLRGLRGSPSLRAGSSTWMILQPAASRSATSSDKASAIWNACLRSNGQMGIIVGKRNAPAMYQYIGNVSVHLTFRLTKKKHRTECIRVYSTFRLTIFFVRTTNTFDVEPCVH